MSYSVLFSLINCQHIIIFEDDFTQNAYTKEIAFYDMIRMDVKDRDLYLEQISTRSKDLAEQFRAFFLEFDKYFDKIDWNQAVPGDVSGAFDIIKQNDQTLGERIIEIYNDIDDAKVKEVYDLGIKYGIGLYCPEQFKDLFKQYIHADKHRKSIRIYDDYYADIAEEFRNDIRQATENECVVCIIDDQLKGIRRAREIIDAVRTENKEKRKNVIGSIFSSQATDDIIDKDVYFELVRKEEKDKLEASIAKSAYNYFIYELKMHTIEHLGNAFDTAIENKGIAFFLSKMAEIEGESEYQIIKDWINLLSMDSQSNTDPIKRLITLAKVINLLEDSQEDDDEDLQKYNTYEAFDYSVNEFFLPIASGDIFKDDKGNWFVLIGQDCDMARRSAKKPLKNALAELLPAELCLQSAFHKFANNQETASIYNFREEKEGPCKILQVKYRGRNYIANEIINLCSFNQDGKCKIHCTNELPDEAKRLMPEYLIEYYKELQDFYKSIDEIKESAGDAFELINREEFAPRLIPISEYEIQDGVRQFKLTRVCRLTHTYVFYLYKLFLEYRGRQPFQSINLVRRYEISLPVKYENEEKKDLSVRFIRIPIPGKKNETRWPWIIEEDDINAVLKQLGIDSNVKLEVKVEGKPEEKQYVLQNEEKLYINQEKEYICFTKR